jgi:hypothetical protein
MKDDIDMKGLDVPGYIYLKIRARDTEANAAVIQGFRQMAVIECDNDYTQTLAKLLEYYQADAKTEMLWEELRALKMLVAELSQKIETKNKEEDDERF